MACHNLQNRGSIFSPEELDWVFRSIINTSMRSLQGRSLSLQLLYSKATNGGDSATFHGLTDNQGPLLTVFETKSAQVGGCYTDDNRGYLQSIGGSNNNDSGAFIFRLRKQAGESDRIQFQPKTASNYTYCHPSYGPTHGAGNDMRIHNDMSQVHTKAGTTWAADAQNFGVVAGVNDTWAPLNALEVFRVVSCAQAVSAPAGWFRYENSPGTFGALQETISRYEKYFRFPANIVLFGNTGSGKSSFVNSVNSAMQGFLMQSALAGTGTGSLTRRLKCYPSCSLPRVCFWDTMGWDESEGAYNSSLNDWIFDGNLASGTQLDSKVTSKSPGYRQNPTVRDRMHAVVGVLACVEATNPATLAKLGRLWKQIIEDPEREDLRLVILLTAPDKFDPEVNRQGVDFVCHSSKLKELRNKVAQSVGILPANVFPVWNYTDEYDIDQGKNVLVLSALKRILEGCVVFFQHLPPDTKTNKS